MERPPKRTKLLSDTEDSDDEGSPQIDVRKPLEQSNGFGINEEYAHRFEHNKKREEQHRLEEKYQNEDEDSSTDESEDDDADLVTADLDNEIMSTLNAIKSKDPRVYDTSMKFYRDFNHDTAAESKNKKKEKPMSLHDYHRENLLSGFAGGDDDGADEPPLTYNEEQNALRRQVVTQMHDLAEVEDGDSGSERDDFRPKRKGTHETVPSIRSRKIAEVDVAAADKDPETYLSNFMAAQAWRTADGPRLHAFDSDDSEEEARADAFEAAYNLRFEDPATANEKLKSFARDNGKFSVRRENTGGRKKARELERAKKEEARQERDEERARLRKLKIDAAEERLKKIRHAAGIRGKDVDLKEWADILEGDFDDAAWDREMNTRFGDDYYDGEDADMGSDDALATNDGKKRKPRKPVWDEELLINDLVPGFDEQERGNFALSEDDAEEDGGVSLDAEDSHSQTPVTKKRKIAVREQEKREAKQKSRLERRAIETIVDTSLPVSSSKAGGFRYRDTSPTSFGLAPRDILFATDAQLNQFAGLKKYAVFRDETRKGKDRKKLGKKARLREWRKEVFGSAEGLPTDAALQVEEDPTVGEVGAPRKGKKRRNKKQKTEHPA